MSKEELIKNVRKWISLDNEIRTLQKEQKKRGQANESIISRGKHNRALITKADNK